MAALGAADKAAEKTDKADKTEKAAERQGDKA
jgi:hypothetical protein